MSKRKPTRESSVVDAPVIGSHVCVAREALVAIIAACDAAGNSSTTEGPWVSIDTIRELVRPYLEAE